MIQESQWFTRRNSVDTIILDDAAYLRAIVKINNHVGIDLYHLSVDIPTVNIDPRYSSLQSLKQIPSAKAMAGDTMLVTFAYRLYNKAHVYLIKPYWMNTTFNDTLVTKEVTLQPMTTVETRLEY